MIPFENIKRRVGPRREALIVNDYIDFIEGDDFSKYPILLDHRKINKSHTNNAAYPFWSGIPRCGAWV